MIIIGKLEMMRGKTCLPIISYIAVLDFTDGGEANQN